MMLNFRSKTKSAEWEDPRFWAGVAEAELPSCWPRHERYRLLRWHQNRCRSQSAIPLENHITDASSRKHDTVLCERCGGVIYGVQCNDNGHLVHFGCASLLGQDLWCAALFPDSVPFEKEASLPKMSSTRPGHVPTLRRETDAASGLSETVPKLAEVESYPYSDSSYSYSDSSMPTDESQSEYSMFTDEASLSDMLKRFGNDCQAAHSMYDFELEVVRAFELSNPRLEQRFHLVQDRLHSEDPHLMQLYHGTSWEHARDIIASGFKLPKHNGMFGKGIYFAGTPLKSWRYSNTSTHSTQFMLVCDVALGCAAERKEAGPPPSKRQLLNAVRCQRIHFPEFDSVTGLSHDQGGVLRVQEHVVYHPDQALPRYLLELREIRSESFNLR